MTLDALQKVREFQRAVKDEFRFLKTDFGFRRTCTRADMISFQRGSVEVLVVMELLWNISGAIGRTPPRPANWNPIVRFWPQGRELCSVPWDGNTHISLSHIAMHWAGDENLGYSHIQSLEEIRPAVATLAFSGG